MSLTFTSIVPVLQDKKSLEQAILETLAYSDVFDYPLTLDELHKYLVIPATKEEVKKSAAQINEVGFKNNLYFFKGRDEIINIRQTREKKSKKIYKRALFYGKILGSFPFVRMVGLTGSLAMLNLSQEVDMDYMLITTPKRLWLARAIAVTFGRLIHLFGDRICVNLLVSENSLLWHPQDLYSAREMCQMIPISGFDTYNRLRIANLWVNAILPNATIETNYVESKGFLIRFQKMFEIFFKGKFGDRLENWLMNFQLNYILKKYGKGIEANFSADMCQGNFHDHRKLTDEVFAERIKLLAKIGEQ